MKIQFRIPPAPGHLHGWKRVVRKLKNLLRGVLVIEVGRITLEFAN